MKRFFTRIISLIFGIAVLLQITSINSYAIEIKSSLAYSPDANEMHRYEFPNGKGFTSTMKNGENNVLIPFIMFDDGVSWKAYCNNSEYSYSNYDIIQQKGAFSFIVYAEVDSESTDIYSADFKFVSTFDEDLLQSEIESAGGTSIDIDKIFSNGNLQSAEKILDNYKLQNIGEILSDNNSDFYGIDKYAKADTSCSYNSEQQMFEYKTSDNNIILLSVPDGMVTSEPVIIKYSNDVRVKLTKDDTEIPEYQSGDSISEPGTYTLLFISDKDGDVDGRKGEVNFRIIGNSVNNMSIFNAPRDFFISSVAYEDELLTFENKNHFVMRQDGTYNFTVKYEKNNNIEYSVKIKKDTLAPTIRISNGGMSGKVSSSVEIYPVGQGEQLSIQYGGQDIAPEQNILKENGIYKISATDEAGNTRNIYLQISNNSSNVFVVIIIMLVLICAAVIYLFIISRQKVQVL